MIKFYSFKKILISLKYFSGLTCRTLAEFGSSGLHHPAEAVRKVSERILIQVYRVNPRLVRKQLPPDDDITRRNLLYRQLFQEFDFMDLQRKRELSEHNLPVPKTNGTQEKTWENHEEERKEVKTKTEIPSHLPKRTVNQQTSPTKPYCPPGHPQNGKEENHYGILRKSKYNKSPPKEKVENFGEKNGDILDKRKSMSRISEERIDVEGEKVSNGNEEHITEDEPTLKFANLVDSVRVAEDRLSFAQKGIRNLKSLKYIFPTSYIGNSTTSQATVNLSNSTNTFCKIVKKPEEKNSPVSYSGIPVPTNGKHSGFLSTVITAKKLMKKTDKTEVVPTVEKEEESKEEVQDELSILTNASMTGSLYIGNGVTEETEAEAGVVLEEVVEMEEAQVEAPKPKEEVLSGSSSASVITSPSEGEIAAADDGKKKEKEGQTFK